MKKEFMEKAKALEPVLRIGKNGLTEGMLKEIKEQLKRKKLIKIKFLKSAMEGKDKKKFSGEVAEKTGGEVVYQVGFVVVLWKR